MTSSDDLATLGTQHPRRITAPSEPPAPRPRIAERVAGIIRETASDLRGGADAADIASRLDGLAAFFEDLDAVELSTYDLSAVNRPTQDEG